MATAPVLLLHCDGTNGSTTFTDSSGGAHAMTAVGNAQITTTSPKFGSGCATFDDAGDGITTPNHVDWNLTGDFTIDFWMKGAAAPTDGEAAFVATTQASSPSGHPGYLLCYHPDGNVYLLVQGSGGSWDLGILATGVVTSTIWNGSWHHIAVTRSGSANRIFVDGVLKNTMTQAAAYNTSNILAIGKDTHDTPSLSWDMQYQLDEVRIIKGEALWTANFTPPTSAPSAGDVFTVDMKYHNGTSYASVVNSTLLSNVGVGITPGSKTLYWHNPGADRGAIEGFNNETVQVTAEPDAGNAYTYTLTVNSASQLTAAESVASIGDVKVVYTLAQYI
jgi:hypothetical protein